MTEDDRDTPGYRYISKLCPLVARVAIVVNRSAHTSTAAAQMPMILIQSYDRRRPSRCFVIFASMYKPSAPGKGERFSGFL